MPRIIIAGVPRAGKTTLAESLSAQHAVKPLHTDDVMSLGWSESSAAVAHWFNTPGSWIIEGVAAPRALRKWLAVNLGAPADVVYWLPQQRIPLTPGQTRMALGCITVWAEVAQALWSRGVKLETVR